MSDFIQITWLHAFTALGFVVFTSWLLGLIFTIVRQLLPSKNLLKRYGDGQKWKQWAVVTGGTDGIGLGFCEVLPKHGFNICIVSRNQQKIQDTISRLQSENPECQFKSIVADFKNGSTIEFYTKILEETQKLDVAILVNNVGTSLFRKVEQISTQELLDQINVNCSSMAILTARMLPALCLRKKSAVINMSSFSAEIAIPLISTYSGTKAFNTNFTEGVSMEYPNIDIISVRPLFVESKLSKAKKGIFVPDRRQHACAVLKELPWQFETNGCLRHRILDKFIHLVPKCIIRFVIPVFSKKSEKKHNKKHD